MIQHIVSEIGGVAILGVISICLFFAVFGGALLWTFCLKKPFLKSMESLPLRDDEIRPARKGEANHA
jgi:hypothetical protein